MKSVGSLGSVESLGSVGSLESVESLGSLGSLESLESLGSVGSLGSLESLESVGSDHGFKERLKYFANPPIVFLTSITKINNLFRCSTEINLILSIRYIILSTSKQLPLDMFKYMRNSLSVWRPKPSAILLEMDKAALLN